MSQEYLEFANAANRYADIARTIIRTEYRKKRQVSVKSDDTPVTPVDRQVELAIRDAIEKNFPHHGILGEEFDPLTSSSEYNWIIDPIDGTKAFIAGLPVFGTLLALTYRSKPVLGILESPITKDRWVGINSHGSTFNGDPIQPRPCKALTSALICTSSPLYFDAVDSDLKAYHIIAKQAQWMVYGGGCHSFARVADGYVDLAFEAEHDIFDYLALVPIIDNAGGYVSDWQGNALTLESGSRFVASGDRRVHDEALEILQI